MAEMRDHFHLFVYGSLRRNGGAAHMLQNATWAGEAAVGGVLYKIDDDYRALVLYGNSPVKGEVWRCPNDLLPVLDDYEGVDRGLFRRIGVIAESKNGPISCWTYAAGPALSRKLVPSQRVEN